MSSTPIPPATAGGRTLSPEQTEALLNVHRDLAAAESPRDLLKYLAAGIARIMNVKVVVAGKRDHAWLIAAESASRPAVSIHSSDARYTFDDLGSGLGLGVDVWRQRDIDWTLVGLSTSPHPPVVLLIEGDWTFATQVLLGVARNIAGNNNGTRLSQPVDVVAQRLTRVLADTNGLGPVGDAVLRHVVQVVPSRMASIAVSTGDEDLKIVATYGYPHVLVEHLRIAPGNGVIGGVYQTRTPLLVTDVSAAPTLERARSRYRTHSFVSFPIIANTEVLGVVSLTDRVHPGPYVSEDLAALSIVMAPAALALGRERVSREAQAYAQAAVIDPVSGLFNRRYFQARLDEELHRATRQLTSVALLMVDLDGFKSINDRFGHIAGDTVIRDISEIMRRSVRIFDVCTRFGGEEFAVMMPGGTAESAGTIAERIRQRVEAYYRSEPELMGLRVTASIGVAVSPPGATARDLIERADRALYHAKRAGKNRVSTAGPDGAVASA